MKITFQNSPDITNESIATLQHTVRHTAQGYQSVENTSAVRVDFGGRHKFLARQADRASAFAQIQQAAGAVDAKVQQDYMTLMSNTMSEEDYKQLQRDGFEIRQMEPEEACTILDKIKAELAKAGTRVAGYNDDLDRETLEAALGSAALAEALACSFYEADLPLAEDCLGEIRNVWEMASSLEQPADGTYQFMIGSSMPAEIESFYLAQSSGAGAGNTKNAVFYEEEIQGYYAQTAEKEQSASERSAEEFQVQIDRVITESGREVNGESRERAAWLLEHNLPLTAENLETYEELSSVTFPVTEEIFAKAVAGAVLEGKQPARADLARAQADEESVYEKAARLLREYGIGEQEETGRQTISDRRLLEEIRLRMTTEVNLKLLRSGFSIDTSTMEEFVEALKTAEKQVAEQYFKGDPDAVSKYEDYQAVNRAVQEIPDMPAQILGDLRIVSEIREPEDDLQVREPAAEAEITAETEESAPAQRKPTAKTAQGETQTADTSEKLTTLSEIYEEGKALKRRLEQAGERYEALLTAPRADMGDTIRKAFANVDAILEDLGLEITEENQKAVRVLGYNRMELSAENIRNVREAQRIVGDVIEKMTPASVLKMIRDGINPLEKNFEELSDYFRELAPDDDRRAESYSRFLYRMERQGEISEEERESFVGIYRMLHQIGRQDGAAVGGVLDHREELRFSRLLSAARSRRSSHMDFRLSEQEKSVVSLLKDENLIDDQIDRAYRKQRMEEIRSAAQAGDDVREMLERGEVPVNADHLLAAEGLLKEAMVPFGKAGKYLSKKGDAVTGTQSDQEIRSKSALDQILGLWEKLDTPEAFREEYREEMKELEESVREEVWQAKDSLDVRELRLLSKQLSIAGALSEKEEYYLPLETGDGRTAKLHLTLEQGGAERGKVTVEVEDGDSRTCAKLWLSDGKVTGILQGNGREEVMKLSKASDIFSEYLREESSWSMDAGLTVADTAKAGESAAAVRGSRATDKLFESAAKETHPKEQPDQRELFRLAKMWIRAVTQKEAGNENQL